MRLPGITIELAKPTTKERGYPGGVAYDGDQTFGAETDPNELWRPPSRWATVRSMLTDPDINAALDAVLLPLLSAGLTVEPGTEDARGAEIAEFLQNDLDNMSNDLQDHRYGSLFGALTDGVAPYQKVFAFDKTDGRVHLRKLATRPARTVTAWHTDDNGGPDGITQLDLDGVEVRFEMDELLVFAPRRRQGGLVGDSLLRRAYGSWKIKSDLSKTGVAAVDRGAMGVPVMRPGRADAPYLKRVNALLSGIRSAAKAYVRLEPDQDMSDFDIKGISGKTLDPVPQMEFHRRGIYLALLCPFLPLGSGGEGSLALSREQASFFLMLLRSVAKLEESTYNRYLFPQWVSWNFGEVPENEMPKATVGALDTRDARGWFESVQRAVQSGVGLDRESLRDMAHEMLGLPEPVEPQVDAPPPMPGDDQDAPPIPPPPAEVPADATADVRAARLAEYEKRFGVPGKEPLPDASRLLARQGKDPLPSIVALEALGIQVNFADIEGRLDEMRDTLVKKLGALQRKQARRMIAKARKLIKARDAAGLDEVKIEYDEEAAVILAELELMYQYGKDEYRGEVERQGGKPDKPSAEDEERSAAYLEALAAEHAARMADRMRTAWGTETLAQMESGWDADRMAERVTAAPEKLLGDLGNQAAGQSFGLGRKVAAIAAAAIITGEIYSTMLDGTVCGVCQAHEAKFYLIGRGPSAPNPDCEGGEARCRCVRIPVYRGGASEKGREKSRAIRRGER